jgi:hypothetical protein
MNKTETLKMYQKLIMGYIEPFLCFLSLIFVFSPKVFFQNVLYLSESEISNSYYEDPIVLTLIRFCGILINGFGIGLYSVCNLKNLPLQKKIFAIMLVSGDIPTMILLGLNVKSFNPSFYIGTIFSVIFAFTRFSVLFN